MGEQAADDTMTPLHRVEVAVPVAAADGHAGDEVVQDEVVEHDEPRRPPERVEDPTVRVGVVADVVDGEIGAARRSLRAALHDLDRDVLPERREQQRRVVRDPRGLRGHRREVRDLHESSLAIARSQVTSPASAFPAAPNAAASSSWSRSQAAACPIAGASGATTSPVCAVVHDVERASGVGRRDHGLAREERLVRPHAEVLVDGRVEDRRARRVELREALRADAALEAHATVEPAVVGDRLEPLAVGAVGRDDDVEAGRCARPPEQEIDPLRAVEAARGEHESLGRRRAVRQRLGRMRKHLGVEAGRALEPPGDVRGRREQARRLREGDPVELLDLPAERAILGRRPELAEVGAVELVRLTELVDEPHALVRVADDVRRELRRDHDVDPAPVRLLEVEHSPEERLRQDAGARDTT